MTRLKGRFPAIDVILMTGSVDDLDEKLVRAIRSKAFFFIQKPFDREVLETLVERCLDLRRLGRENRNHLARLEQELASARTFQQRLLPEPQAQVEGIAIDFRYLPCSALGGDFCDYARAGDGRAGIIIADVSGHGVSAAMLTGIVKASFHAAAADGYEPRAVVRRISVALAPFSAERFVTLIAARVAGGGEGLTLEFVNAGHPPGLLWRGSGGLSRLEPTGPIVSPALPREFCRWEQRVERLRAGDGVLLYTDGASDALSEGDDFFGEDRLAAAALAPGVEEGRLDRVLAAIRAHAAGRPLEDDLTLLYARARTP
jgi:serine phosphatase RsbU (regulator of sigma subunit)